MSLYIDIQNDTIFELFRQYFVFLQRSFGFPEVTAVLWVLGNFLARTRLVLHQYDPIHTVLG